MGPLVSAAQQEKVLGYMRLGVEEGARLVLGGAEATRLPSLPNGFWVAPTIFADVTDGMRIAREEIFGPVLSVLDFEDEDEVIARANDTELGPGRCLHQRHHPRAPGGPPASGGLVLDQRLQLDPGGGTLRRREEVGCRAGERPGSVEHYSQLKTVYVALNPVDSPYDGPSARYTPHVPPLISMTWPEM